MTYIRYAFLALIGALFVTVALANRELVTVQSLPDPLASLVGTNFSFETPLYVLIGGSVILGLLLGFVWEWVRERGYRAETARARADAERLRAELGRVRRTAPEAQEDDVLALMESSDGRERQKKLSSGN